MCALLPEDLKRNHRLYPEQICPYLWGIKNLLILNSRQSLLPFIISHKIIIWFRSFYGRFYSSGVFLWPFLRMASHSRDSLGGFCHLHDLHCFYQLLRWMFCLDCNLPHLDIFGSAWDLRIPHKSSRIYSENIPLPRSSLKSQRSGLSTCMCLHLLGNVCYFVASRLLHFKANPSL